MNINQPSDYNSMINQPSDYNYMINQPSEYNSIINQPSNILNTYIKIFSKNVYEITNEISNNRPLDEVFNKNNRMLYLGIFLILFSILLIPILS